MDKSITIFEAFELNRILQEILTQQSSYDIQISFKIYSLIKQLSEIEEFIFNRLRIVSDNSTIDINDPLHKALLSSKIAIKTDLSIEELLQNDGEVKINVYDVEIIEKILSKTYL